ncbi:hypothetical protein [Streptomyces atratus]|uniref:hypothetical protein n=1 Tax=Streptomyces atratus TaxID=1893 RepID=UPI0033F47362
MSSTALAFLLKEWDCCRWVRNQCVAESKAASRVRERCGPAGLDKKLTGWRTEHAWLGRRSPGRQQQTVRDFGKSRTAALYARRR